MFLPVVSLKGRVCFLHEVVLVEIGTGLRRLVHGRFHLILVALLFGFFRCSLRPLSP